MAAAKINDGGSFQQIGNVLTQLDDLRGEELEKLHILNQIKTSALEREKDRLEEKYGSAHPRVINLDAQLNYRREQAKSLEEEVKLAKIKVPEFQPDSWRVQGIVRDRNRQSVANLTIALFDTSGNWIKGFGFASTNEQGYFVLTIQDEDGKLTKEYQGEKLFLAVSDEKERVLHEEKAPLFLSVGQIEFREIVLSEAFRGAPPPRTKDEPKLSSIPHPKFVVFRGKDKQYYFHLTAANGEIILQSEGYKQKRSAVNGIESARKNAEAGVFEKKIAKNRQHYFILKAKNNQVLGVSETYTTKAAMDEGIRLVTSIAPGAEVEYK